jgi:hypothetical protein
MEQVDAWQLESWAAYRDVVRLGRKTRLAEKQRVILWAIFEPVPAALKVGGLVTLLRPVQSDGRPTRAGCK